ncbi:MAG TPA: hypothetical protein VM617_01630 [Thermoanaerobaculia bacterium]|nr:hypothetical protein [Thermoanaerobaculia bacterium]
MSLRRLLACSLLVALAAVARPATAQELPPPALVLGDGRFAVTATFEAPGAAPSPAFPVALTRDSGYFWFFDADNVEVVVKVLEACPVNGHVWVFAAGLTNVGVELSVEDRLGGATWHRSHAAGPAFEPIQDTAAFTTCGLAPSCGQGTTAEIAATPRADRDAELIALFLGGGLTAPQDLYERVQDDLAALRAAYPDELADVPFAPRHDARSLLLGVPPPVAAAIADETYDEWDCLNDWYRAEDAGLLTSWLARVRLDGVFDTERIAAEYAQLPGVETATVDSLIRVAPHEEYLCALGQGETIHYFADVGDGYLHFTSQPGATPQPAGSWSPALPEAEPAWFPLFEACVELYVADCCALS